MSSGKVTNDAESLMWAWHEWKLFLEGSVAFSHDAVHVIAGVLVQIAAALLLRKPLSSWWPWTVVFVATFLNEIVDLWVERWPDAAMQYGEGLKDLLLTMLLPTVLFVASRTFPRLFEPNRRSGRVVGPKSK